MLLHYPSNQLLLNLREEGAAGVVAVLNSMVGNLNPSVRALKLVRERIASGNLPEAENAALVRLMRDFALRSPERRAEIQALSRGEGMRLRLSGTVDRIRTAATQALVQTTGAGGGPYRENCNSLAEVTTQLP